MPILTIQRRQTEVGRIRIGESVDTGRTNKHGQPIRKPVKLQKFRFTSASKTLIEQVAAAFGGTPAEWEPQGGGAKQWEVYTDAQSISVVVPPNAVSQWYEAWNGGQCVRRCDGQREMLKDRPCVCPADPGDRNPMSDCKPTTRVSLMLADVPGIGVWRLESHGFYAATELPAAAELLAAAGGYIAGRLEIEQRTAKRPKANGNGVETRHWMVPVLHVDAAPKAILSGTPVQPQREVEGPPVRPQIEAAPANTLTAERVLEMTAMCKTVAQVKQLWEDAKAAGPSVLTDGVKTALTAQAERLGAAVKPVSGPPVAEAPANGGKPQPAPVTAEVEPNPDDVFALIMNAAPADWGTAGVQQRIEVFAGKPLTEADGFDLQRFLVAVRAGEVA